MLASAVHALLYHPVFVVHSSAKTLTRSRVRDLRKPTLEKALKKQVVPRVSYGIRGYLTAAPKISHKARGKAAAKIAVMRI